MSIHTNQQQTALDSPRHDNDTPPGHRIHEEYTSLSDLMIQEGARDKRRRSSAYQRPTFTVGTFVSPKTSSTPQNDNELERRRYGVLSDTTTGRDKKKLKGQKLTFMQILALTVSMGGSQVRLFLIHRFFHDRMLKVLIGCF